MFQMCFSCIRVKSLLRYLGVISVWSGTAFQFCFQLVYLWCECETYCAIVSGVLRFISGGVLFCYKHNKVQRLSFCEQKICTG